jgi:hypothetical protein
MLQLTIWFLFFVYLIWRSFGALNYLRRESFSASAAKSLLFLGFMWVALIGYGVRFYSVNQ